MNEKSIPTNIKKKTIPPREFYDQNINCKAALSNFRNRPKVTHNFSGLKNEEG